MTTTRDTDHMLNALSARVSVIEMAITALGSTEPEARRRVIGEFDVLAQTLLTQFISEPIEESYIDLVRKSIDDMRFILSGGRSEQ